MLLASHLTSIALRYAHQALQLVANVYTQGETVVVTIAYNRMIQQPSPGQKR